MTGSGIVAQTDLDAFMRDVVARRDDNWKKLEQYVLDEREIIELRGPSHVPIWGERRDYTWYLRDGFFVRSPVAVNGAAVSEAERLEYERKYLKRVQERDQRGARGRDDAPSLDGSAASAAAVPNDADSLIRQTRQPGFISSAYFLRFKFEEGRYALVGREKLDGRNVLRVEYYPQRLFGGTDRRRGSRGSTEEDRQHDKAFQGLMNKVALVTLWVEPDAHQIVKYTFDNVSLEFLPGQWLVHVDDARASMTMSQPFADVWLPKDLEFTVGLTLANGPFALHYGVSYLDYRRAEVGTKLTVPPRP